MSDLPVHYYKASYYWLLQKKMATIFCDQWKIRLYLWESILETNAETPVALLPALTSAVRQEENGDVLKVLAGYGRLANRSHSWSDLQPWPIKLVEAWKERLEKADWYGGQQITALRALVTLDRCGVVQAAGLQTLLPLFLSKANAALNHYGEARYYDLSVLARWHLPPGMAVNQCDQKTLAAWINFWEACQSGDDRLLSAIATQALLYLAEVGIPLKTSLKELLGKLAEIIRETDCEQLFWLTLWHPTTFNPAFREVVKAWLERTQCTFWLGRKAVWQTLIDWDQRGILTQYGIDLLPRLVTAAKEEKNSQVLSVLAKWSPPPVTSGTTGDTTSFLSALYTRWQILTKAASLEYQRVGWTGRINIVHKGKTLPSEIETAFWEEYTKAVESKADVTLLIVFATLLLGNLEKSGVWIKAWDSYLKNLEDRIHRRVVLLAVWNYFGSDWRSRSLPLELRMKDVQFWKIGISMPFETSELIRFMPHVANDLADGVEPPLERPRPTLPPELTWFLIS